MKKQSQILNTAIPYVTGNYVKIMKQNDRSVAQVIKLDVFPIKVKTIYDLYL